MGKTVLKATQIISDHSVLPFRISTIKPTKENNNKRFFTVLEVKRKQNSELKLTLITQKA